MQESMAARFRPVEPHALLLSGGGGRRRGPAYQLHRTDMPHPFVLALPSTAPRRRTAGDPTQRPPGLAAREGADDGELIAWAGTGDRAAFDVLVARHGERALRLAPRALGDPAEAEDVAQEAFLRAWRAAARFDPDRARVSTWLHRIVSNLAIDRVRRRGAAPPLLDLADDVPEPADGPDAGLDAAAERAALDAALAELPPRQRAAVALAYEDGLGRAEAAAALFDVRAGAGGAAAPRPAPAAGTARRRGRRMRPGVFARRLDARGPALGRWPEGERRAAEALLAASPEARASHRRALALDAALRHALPEPEAAALDRLRAGVARRIARSPLPAPPGPVRRLLDGLRPAAPAASGALAAALCCGLWLVLTAAPPAEDPLGPLASLPLAGEAL